MDGVAKVLFGALYVSDSTELLCVRVVAGLSEGFCQYLSLPWLCLSFVPASQIGLSAHPCPSLNSNMLQAVEYS